MCIHKLTGVDLSKYDSLLSVVPPSDMEASALRDLINQMGWSYVSVISSSEYNSLATAFMDTGTLHYFFKKMLEPLAPFISHSETWPVCFKTRVIHHRCTLVLWPPEVVPSLT